MGGVPTPHVLSCFFKSRENVPDRERLSGFAAGKAAKRRTESRFAKPRSSIARAACRPDRGKLPACQEVPEREAFLRSFCFCKKNQKAGAARCPVFYPAFSKAGEMFPKRNGFILFASTKRTKSSPEGCDPLDSGDGSKLYGKIFFVTFLTFVPKPVYGATHFFGCFEPVRKGCCSADARPLFFENGML